MVDGCDLLMIYIGKDAVGSSKEGEGQKESRDL